MGLQSFISKHVRSRSKSPTRKASKTNQQNQPNEITSKAEIRELKQQKQKRNNTEATLANKLKILKKILKKGTCIKRTKGLRRNHENFGNLNFIQTPKIYNKKRTISRFI